MIKRGLRPTGKGKKIHLEYPCFYHLLKRNSCSNWIGTIQIYVNVVFQLFEHFYVSMICLVSVIVGLTHRLHCHTEIWSLSFTPKGPVVVKWQRSSSFQLFQQKSLKMKEVYTIIKCQVELMPRPQVFWKLSFLSGRSTKTEIFNNLIHHTVHVLYAIVFASFYHFLVDWKKRFAGGLVLFLTAQTAIVVLLRLDRSV